MATQKFETIQADSLKIRDDLANWQKTLDERDKNLKVREVNVQIDENYRLNNVNLLNL